MWQPLRYVHPLKQESLNAELQKVSKIIKILYFPKNSSEYNHFAEELINMVNFIGNETLNIKNTSWCGNAYAMCTP